MNRHQLSTHLEILAADVGHVHVVCRGTDVLVFLAGEDVEADHVDLGVTVLSGFGGGHLDNFAWTGLQNVNKMS